MRGTITTTDGTKLPIEIKVNVIPEDRRKGPTVARANVCFFGELWMNFDVLNGKNGVFAVAASHPRKDGEWQKNFIMKREFAEIISNAIVTAYNQAGPAPSSSGYQEQATRYAPPIDSFPDNSF